MSATASPQTIPSPTDSMELWHLAPNSAAVCLHCGSRRLENAEAGQSWEVYGTAYALLHCTACDGLFTFPSPTPETLNRLYKEAFSYKWYADHYPAKFLDSLHRVLQYEKMGVLHKPAGKLLDYGGGVGYFSKAARFCGYDAETRDPMYERVETGSSAAAAPPATYQTVACHHVLEHAIDPSTLLADIHQRLQPDGKLIIAVPNASSAGYQKLGVRWTWSQPPLIHLHHFTPTGLRALLVAAGFAVTQEHYFDRWDANTVSDVRFAKLFMRLDGIWSRTFFQWLAAQRNSLRRFAALAASELVVRPPASERAELLMVAERLDRPPARS